MGVKSKPTQNERILDYIEKYGSISQLEAMHDLGVMRLASRISDLKRKGYTIISCKEAVKNRHGEVAHIKRYSLGVNEYESTNTTKQQGAASYRERG